MGHDKFQVYTTGWDADMEADEFESFLNHLKFFPLRVRKIQVHQTTPAPTSGFLLTFPNMKVTKLVFMRLRRMKRRWQLPQSQILYAYPKLCDVHWSHETRYADE